MLRNFWNDENGFLISAELILLATITVIGLIVGMAEIQWAVIGELNDVADAIGSLNQSFAFSGFCAHKQFGNGLKSQVAGSMFVDVVEECDNNQCQMGCDQPMPEHNKY
jgi:Flp pilus assembly pilin Flp